MTTERVDWVWIPDYDFLQANRLGGMVPWVLPRGNSLGHTRVNYDKAVAAGLTFRPLAVSVKDTLDWWNAGVPAERRAQARFMQTIEREPQVIAAWKARPR